MRNVCYQGFDCVQIENAAISLLVTRSVGPRLISLSLHGGENLLAVLPDFVTRRPDGKAFHFYGGHRLWHAPENMPRTYALDDGPVEISPADQGLLAIQPAEQETGLQKSIQISLAGGGAQVLLRHTLANRGRETVECAAWAITQLRTGGVAILPQSTQQTDMLPNRSLALWPYTDIGSPHACWGNDYILIQAEMQPAFKLGFPNPRGWLAYWLEGTLFVKRADFDPRASYYDFGSSSECYSNGNFLELETLGPITRLEPGEELSHVETWELYEQDERPSTEDVVRDIVEKMGWE